VVALLPGEPRKRAAGALMVVCREARSGRRGAATSGVLSAARAARDIKPRDADSQIAMAETIATGRQCRPDRGSYKPKRQSSRRIRRRR